MNRKINWQQIINDILHSDKSINCSRIAEMLNVSNSAISRLRCSYVEPKYTVGAQLIEMHKRATNKQIENMHYAK